MEETFSSNQGFSRICVSYPLVEEPFSSRGGLFFKVKDARFDWRNLSAPIIFFLVHAIPAWRNLLAPSGNVLHVFILVYLGNLFCHHFYSLGFGQACTASAKSMPMAALHTQCHKTHCVVSLPSMGGCEFNFVVGLFFARFYPRKRIDNPVGTFLTAFPVEQAHRQGGKVKIQHA